MSNVHEMTPDQIKAQDSNKGTFIVVAGGYAKVKRGDDTSTERFWVRVHHVNKATGICIGTVDNDLRYSDIHGFHCDDRIAFTVSEVLQVMGPSNER